jgi:hypothetical protein
MEMCEQELRSAVGMSGSNLKSGECEMPTIMVDSFFVVISFWMTIDGRVAWS